MIVYPVVDNIGGIIVAGLEMAKFFESLINGKLNCRAEKVLFAFKVVVGQRGINPSRIGDILDCHRSEIALGE
jgi:hypothetical protein